MSDNSKKILTFWFPPLIWAGMIFIFSNQPDLKSGLREEVDFILRKGAHITEYAILTFLLMRAFIGYEFSIKKALLFSFLISVLYATSDEYHQTYISGRQGTIRDVFVDSVGILAVLIIMYYQKPKFFINLLKRHRILGAFKNF